MPEKVGLKESVSMAVGGMVGGGIFAVLGVVASAAGPISWFAFITAGIIAACSGYSFIRLNNILDGANNPINFIEEFTGNRNLAGMAGWTFVFGYIGTMAMYAFAFGGYFQELSGLHTITGIPVRPLISFLVIAGFVTLNVLGAHASGKTENLLVALKITILLVFCLAGLYYGFSQGKISSGLDMLGFGSLIAAAISFVAFEGWELLMFDQGTIKDPKKTIRKAIYISIGSATALYVLVAVVTTNLLKPSVIARHSETALAIAAKPFLGSAGFVLISLAAMLSTGSAINATLFSSSRLSRKLVSEKLLPHELRDESANEPIRALLVLGALTSGLTVLGSLKAITSFASLAFITIFGSVSLLAFRKRDSLRNTVPPLVGVLGSAATVVTLLWHLYSTEIHVFYSVFLIAALVVSAELLYFKRDEIEEASEDVEEEAEELEEEAEEIGDEVEENVEELEEELEKESEEEAEKLAEEREDSRDKEH